MRNTQKLLWLFFVLLSLVLPAFPALAQEEPITKIDLGVSSLHLSVGESYTFHVTYEPENTILKSLGWVVTDESVISLDPLTNTVTARAEGEARIFAESFDRFSYAVCDVTVGDSVSKDAAVMKSGSEFMDLSPEEMEKITAETLRRFVDFAADSAMNDASYEHVSGVMFEVLAAVKPGTEDAQAQLARECGIIDPEALREVNAVTLYGSMQAILNYVKNNADLLEVFELGPFYFDDPVETDPADDGSGDNIPKAMNLQGKTQKHTNINFAHSLGLTGKGRTIAIIDSGLDPNNPLFAGKPSGTITEVCFSKGNVKLTNGTLYSVCPKDGGTGRGASTPSQAQRKDKFNHGSHVSGIAAGRDGIAPSANIISIQTHTERRWRCTDADERKNYLCPNDNTLCCKTNISSADLVRAYNYLIDLAKKGTKIDAVNMSYGDSGKYANSKDAVKGRGWEKTYIDKMIPYGILPVAASGNEKLNGTMCAPGAFSNVYAVGALSGWVKPPKITSFSNHNQYVAITAPGYEILSASYSKPPTMLMSGTSMAAPMVTGAVALVKQLYPGMSGEEAGQFLKAISNKSVNLRSNGKKFNYNIPILNFTNILSNLRVPYYSRIIGGDKSITIQLDRPAYKNQKYAAAVTTLNGTAISGIKTQWKTVGNYVYVKISGPQLQNGTIYKINLTRTLTVGKKQYKASTIEYGRPMGNMNASSLTVKPGNSSATLTIPRYRSGVQYRIYDAKTGRFVLSDRTKNASAPLEIRSLKNGTLYKVTVQSYDIITINKKSGNKVNIKFYGPESKQMLFMPLSAPVNATYGYDPKNKTTYSISCAKDPNATGIRVRYKEPGSDSWKIGCKSDVNKFFCRIPNINKKGTLFEITKFKVLNGKTYSGPSTIIKN